MSKANVAAEPSMDEILASIRRIIQEDPASTRAGRAPTLPLPSEPLLPPSALWGSTAAAKVVGPDVGADATVKPAKAAEANPPTDWARALAQGIAVPEQPAADDDLAELTGDPIAASSATAIQAPHPERVIDAGSRIEPTEARGLAREEFKPQPEPHRFDGPMFGALPPRTLAPAEAELVPVPIEAPVATKAPTLATTLARDLSTIPQSADADPVGAAAARSALGALAAGLAAARTTPDRVSPSAKVAAEPQSVALTEAAPLVHEASASTLEPSASTAPAASPIEPTIPVSTVANVPASLATVPAPVDRTQRLDIAAEAPSAAMAAAAAVDQIAAPPAVEVVDAAPGPVPAAPHSDGPLEENVAQLLRPMLRNWLDTHMPRIVEKALREEIKASQKKS